MLNVCFKKTTSPQGFKDNYASTANDFSYDSNGNMITDNNKGIRSIVYNHLNLPTKINFVSNGLISYLYTATGQKLQKFVKDVVSNTNTTTDYLSGFQYFQKTASEPVELQFFPHAEGYVHYTKPLQLNGLGAFNYVFNYTDHLGNVRVSFAKDPQQGNVLKILEENHYYPFGMKHTNYNSDKMTVMKEQELYKIKPTSPELLTYKYKYNGKELQEELGLNMYDYGARNYDPALGRWMNVDPLAEKLPHASPYAFCLNNPVNMFDPDGKYPYPVYIRAFAPFETFGGGFAGDNRGFSTSTSVTSRLAQSFILDTDNNICSNFSTTSSSSSHPWLGSATATDDRGTFNGTHTTNADGSVTMNFTTTMAGHNPLVPGSPDIDVKTSFSLTENKTAGTLGVNVTQTGDAFPSAETMIGDTKGNMLMIGVSPAIGNPYTSLPGDGNKSMMSANFTVTMDGKGVFTGVKQGDKTYSVADWNKMMQATPAVAPTNAGNQKQMNDMMDRGHKE